MRRNCNLTLRLMPPCSDPNRNHEEEEEEPTYEVENKNQNQPLTIFYDGRISVCDVTDLQARAILKVANEEIEEKLKNKTGSLSSEPSSPFILSPTPSPSPYPSPSGLSMKRSLLRFLQKRKNRIQTASPYHH